MQQAHGSRASCARVDQVLAAELNSKIGAHVSRVCALESDSNIAVT